MHDHLISYAEFSEYWPVLDEAISTALGVEFRRWRDAGDEDHRVVVMLNSPFNRQFPV